METSIIIYDMTVTMTIDNNDKKRRKNALSKRKNKQKRVMLHGTITKTNLRFTN